MYIAIAREESIERVYALCCMYAESHMLGMLIMSTYLLGNAQRRLYTITYLEMVVT